MSKPCENYTILEKKSQIPYKNLCIEDSQEEK